VGGVDGLRRRLLRRARAAAAVTRHQEQRCAVVKSRPPITSATERCFLAGLIAIGASRMIIAIAVIITGLRGAAFVKRRRFRQRVRAGLQAFAANR